VNGRSRAESQVGVRLMGVWRVSYSNIQEFFFFIGLYASRQHMHRFIYVYIPRTYSKCSPLRSQAVSAFYDFLWVLRCPLPFLPIGLLRGGPRLLIHRGFLERPLPVSGSTQHVARAQARHRASSGAGIGHRASARGHVASWTRLPPCAKCST
jgi:hypothetical protein